MNSKTQRKSRNEQYRQKLEQLASLCAAPKQVQKSRSIEAAPKPRNIVVCSDGTSNEFGPNNTNVATLYVMVESSDDQIKFYDPGVGTLGDRAEITWLKRHLTKLLGLALARGITRNIEDAYIFLMDNYRPGDRLFLFGFSRGAYTVRALAGMIHRVGLLPKGLDNLVPYASKAHRGDAELAEIFKNSLSRKDECIPYFVGVWDTVKSVGFFFPRRFPNDVLNTSIKFGRHALALDERRGMFQPTEWAAPAHGQDIKQEWFPGDHCDVGGGRFETALSDAALRWMADEAENAGLKLIPNWQDRLQDDAGGPIHDRVPWKWWWFPFCRRSVPKAAKLHQSVSDRQSAVPGYGRKIEKPVTAFERLLGAAPCVLFLAGIGTLSGLLIGWIQGDIRQYVVLGIALFMLIGLLVAVARRFLGGN